MTQMSLSGVFKFELRVAEALLERYVAPEAAVAASGSVAGALRGPRSGSSSVQKVAWPKYAS